MLICAGLGSSKQCEALAGTASRKMMAEVKLLLSGM
jgi:hypothetical protein